MKKYGLNLMLFGDVINAGIRNLFPVIKEIGFDGIEVPVFQPGMVECEEIAIAAKDAGLEVTCSGALPVGTRFYGDDARAKASASDYLARGIEVAAGLGATIWVGPLYKAVGDFDMTMPLERQLEETANTMKPLLKIAEDSGVVLGFEPLNRFETNLINTVSGGLAFCREVDSPNAALLLDTFHMHIEEKSSAAAIQAAVEAGKLAHFHCSENDRGIPGTGQVRWSEVSAAVERTGYDKWFVLETFNQDNLAIKKAAACWRSFYPSADAFMREGLRFVKETFQGGASHA